jgi:hypothetical protein
VLPHPPMKSKTVAGTVRIADGTPVLFPDAVHAWVLAGRPVLEAVARRYGALITYKELAEEVQVASGIRTGAPMRRWIGRVLGGVALQCYREGTPLLSALCVHQDGTIGDGYAVAIAETYGDHVGEGDIEMRGAEERLACYRYFGATLPSDGGHPMLAPDVAAKRERQRRRVAPPAQRPSCPVCHLVLPMSGRCNNCSRGE